MNLSNGEIISFVSLPYFAPNKKLGQNDKCRFNMVTPAVIEPRISAKNFKASMTLETGKITSFTQISSKSRSIYHPWFQRKCHNFISRRN